MTTIERSAGLPIRHGMVCWGFAGGGYEGATSTLDSTVMHAADLLRVAFDMDVTVRFNSDRESGGAWLHTHAVDGIGANSELSIGASIVTDCAVRRAERHVARYGDDEWATERLADLRANVGRITVIAHMRRAIIADPVIAAELCTGTLRDSYFHVSVPDVESGLAMVCALVDLDALRAVSA